MSNNIPLNIQNGTSFDGIQDGQLCYEGNKIVYRDGDNRIDLFDTYATPRMKLFEGYTPN